MINWIRSKRVRKKWLNAGACDEVLIKKYKFKYYI